MDNAYKQLFFGPILYPSITCPICNSPEIDTWPHVLLSCTNPHIHALRIKRHNKAVTKIRKLLVSSSHSRGYIFMNAGIYDGHPLDNTIPPWLLACVCQSPQCQCDVRFKPDILCICGVPYKHEPPHQPSPNVIIQYIEFTYCNDRFSLDKVASKQTKYDSLLNNICARGWNVVPIIIITAGARATTHIPSITSLHDTFKIPIPTITHTLKNINIIAIHHAMSIFLHKRRIENHQPLPDP
jgi:hypothetical protein